MKKLYALLLFFALFLASSVTSQHAVADGEGTLPPGAGVGTILTVPDTSSPNGGTTAIVTSIDPIYDDNGNIVAYGAHIEPHDPTGIEPDPCAVYGYNCPTTSGPASNSEPYADPGISANLSGAAFYDQNHTHQYTPGNTLIPNAGSVRVESLSQATYTIANIGFYMTDGTPLYMAATNSSSNPNVATIAAGYYVYDRQAAVRNKFTYTPSASAPTSQFLGWDVVYMVGATQLANGNWTGGTPRHVYYPGYTFDTRDSGNSTVYNSVPSNASYIMAAHVMFDAPFSVNGVVWEDKNGNNTYDKNTCTATTLTSFSPGASCTYSDYDYANCTEDPSTGIQNCPLITKDGIKGGTYTCSRGPGGTVGNGQYDCKDQSYFQGQATQACSSYPPLCSPSNEAVAGGTLGTTQAATGNVAVTVTSTSSNTSVNSSPGNSVPGGSYGGYSLQRLAGSWSVTESGPAGYGTKVIAGNSNPRAVTLPAAGFVPPAAAYTSVAASYLTSSDTATVVSTGGGNRVTGNVANVNFQIDQASSVTCGSLTANPATVTAGVSTSLLSANNCAPASPPITYTWGAPLTGTLTNCPGSSSTCTYTPPATLCAATTVTQSVTADNGAGGVSPTTPVRVLPNNRVTGVVHVDTNNDNCATTTGISTQVQLIEAGNSQTIGSTTSAGNGTYTVTDANTNTLSCNNKHLVLPGKTIKKITVDGTDNTSFSGSDFGPFSMNQGGTRTIDICVAGVSSWFQTTTGDVRYPLLSDSIPASALAPYLSSDATSPGIAFSSTTDPLFQGGSASNIGWKAGREYLYNNDFEQGLGATSYSFYKSQAQKKQQPVTKISSGVTSVDLSTLSSGIYEAEGNVTIYASTGSVTGGKHIIFLGDQNVTVGDAANPILNVPAGAGNLLVVAVKGNLLIDANVGTATVSQDTSTQLDGLYSAEGDIIVQSKHTGGLACPGTQDNRLNVGGSFVSNSLHPFATTGAGSVQNARSLCASDATYPSLKVYARPDMILQMTDFYKTAYKQFREVEP